LVPPLLEPLLSLAPGEVLLEPMLPLGLAAEFGFAAFEPLTGPEGLVMPPLSVVPLLGLAALLGLAVPALGAMLLLELPPAPGLVALPPLSWAKTAGVNAATDNANPAPRR
jgi:hypothetical protein